MVTTNNLRSRTSKWFECTVKYQKTMDDGTEKMVSERYVVDALSFTEAEARIIEEISTYVSGELGVTEIRPAAYREVFFSDNNDVDRWYKVRIAFITIDERTEKEKKSYSYYLVNASCLNEAIKNLDQAFANSMLDYQSVNVTETMILDVFEHEGGTMNESKTNT